MGKIFKTKEEAKQYASDNGWATYRLRKVIRGEKPRYYVYFYDENERNDERLSSGAKKDGFSKKAYMRTARQLCYPPQVLEELAKAKNDAEATRIMHSARELYL